MPFPPGNPSRLSPARRPAAFTLVEMLAVIAIIAVLLAVTGPLVRGILSSRNVGDGLDAISGYLAYARTQAVTQNTYVIVGFAQASGSDDLQMASVISSNGTFSPGSFNPSNVIGPTTGYPALGKTLHISNVTLVPWTSLGSSSLTNKVPQPDGKTTVECSVSPSYPANESYFSFTAGGKSFSYCVIAFSPQGEALFFPKTPQSGSGGAANFSANLPFYSQLFIGLRATRSGKVVGSDTNAAAITLDGGSGDLKTYRL